MADDRESEAREILPPGTRVSRYEIVRLVGEGGMGTVYEALDLRLNRKVALKVLPEGLKGTRKAAKRFSIEAQAAARLHHPNVVGIFDFDVDCEHPFMAMEFLQGETLAAAIARGPIAPARLADIMLAVCAGVHAAHSAGIVHRDLKPSNIFLCRDWQGAETARVLDFGISKVGGVSGSAVTQEGDIVGTSQYLSPEQAGGQRNVDGASDQYTLGVVMYECLARRTPQQGQQPIASLLQSIAEGRYERLRTIRSDLPSPLLDIIERAMQLQPRHRFPSIRDLGRALLPFASPELQRQFGEFYQRDDTAAVSPQAPRPSGSHADLAPTQRLPVESPPTWQRNITRTSRRSLRTAIADDGSPNPRQASGRMRTILYSVALGTALAIAILVVLGLAIRQ